MFEHLSLPLYAHEIISQPKNSIQVAANILDALLQLHILTPRIFILYCLSKLPSRTMIRYIEIFQRNILDIFWLCVAIGLFEDQRSTMQVF